MLILSSNGLSSEKLRNEILKCNIEGSKAAIITTASVGYKEKDWNIPRLTEELGLLGITYDFFDLDIQPPELLNGYDFIEIIGGNPFYLLTTMRKTNCRVIFEKLINEKIVLGISAGSIVLQNTVELCHTLSPELNNEIKLHDLSGLSFTDLEILPHYSRFVAQIPKLEERVQAYEKEHNCSVLKIEDGQAVFVLQDGPIIV